MKIVIRYLPIRTIEELADEYDLVMEVTERKLSIGDARFWAHFQNCEVIDRGCLVSSYGNGGTEEQAIKNYAKQIDQKRIVINATSSDRREVEVGRLVIV